jgi:hypothetical protein
MLKPPYRHLQEESMLPIYVGFDPREAAVYHVFVQSVIEHAKQPVSFTPLHVPMLNGFDGQQDGTNAFIYSRYLVPYLNGFEGAALFVDGDMLVRCDINELLEEFDPEKAVQVVKHDYQTGHPVKYIGTPLQNGNVDYPRKNQSSVIIFNCGHPSNRILYPEFVESAGGSFLHRFEWLNEDEIGSLDPKWNHLVGEYDHSPKARLLHYTLGAPGFKHYAQCEGSKEWNQTLLNALRMDGEDQTDMVRRARWHRTG